MDNYALPSLINGQLVPVIFFEQNREGNVQIIVVALSN